MSCPSDDELTALLDGDLPSERQAEVESHVDGCAECVALLGELAALAETQGEPPADAPEQFGRFRLERVLGAGAMGVVWLAWDPQLERRVAVKRVNAEHADSAEARARLVREARALARISHPNVVTVHDVGEVDGEVFIATELVEGETLAAWQRERRPWREVVAAWAQAARGLAAVHAENLIHRDVKPSNVFVGRDGRVRVGDFGLARPDSSAVSTVDERGGGAAASLAGLGYVAGTPGYMPPEQLIGGKIDARADQFALCVALVEGLTGRRPLAGARPALRGAPAALAAALARGLAEDPDDRFPAIAELATILERAVRPRRTLAIAAALAAVAAAAIVVPIAVLRHRAPPAIACDASPGAAAVWSAAPRAAIARAYAAADRTRGPHAAERLAAALDAWTRRWVDTSDASCRATARGEQSAQLLDLRAACLGHQLDIVRATIELASHADDQLVSDSDNLARGLPGLDDCADTGGLLGVAPLPVDPAERDAIAAVRTKLASVRAESNAHRAEGAIADGKAAVDRAERTGYPPVVAEAKFELGMAQAAAGDQTDAAPTLWSTIGVDPTRHDALIMRCWMQLSEIANDQNTPAEALELARIALALADHEKLPEDLRARAESDVADGLAATHQEHEAIPYYKRSVDALVRLGDDAALLGVLGAELNTLTALGDIANAKTAVAQLLALAGRHRGDPELASPLVSTALAFSNAGHDDLAQDMLRQARLALGNGDDDPVVAYFLHFAGGAITLNSDRATAQRELAAALDVADSAQLGDRFVMTPAGMLGQLALLHHDFPTCIAYLTRARNASERLPDSVTYEYDALLSPPELLDGLARAHYEIHRYDDAQAEAEQAVALAEAHHLPASELADTHEMLAQVLDKIGEKTRARVLMMKAMEERGTPIRPTP
ncbi:MAG TPA: protein kinase [Kofleriaceae bacterium]|nr:protein kinase [Kofleriaceae bacterium]